MRNVVMVVAVALLLAGCAAGMGGSSGGDRNELTRAQIEEAGQSSALDVVRSERPHWLLHRGRRSINADGQVLIYLDGSRLGGPESLRGIAAVDVERMQYYSASEAQYKWGAGHLHGAIEVITRQY